MTPRFRAWYTPFKDSNFGQTMKYGRAGTILNFAEMSPDKYVVEQYTGLKDVNGNKIFEGDIVRNEHEKTYVVNLKKGSFLVGDFYFESIGAGSELEIIGNIHNNPELLEVE